MILEIVFFIFSRLIIKSIKFYMLTRLGGMRNNTMPNFFQNWAIQSRDIAIFRFSKWPPLHLLFSKSPNFRANGVWRIRLISVSNFGKIGQLVAKILTFFNFLKWWATPSWIFQICHWQKVSGRPILIIVLNIVKIGRLLWRHCNLSNFQNGHRRHLRSLK